MHSTHGQCREAWKTAESCGVTGSVYLKDREDRLSLFRVWVTVGTGPQCCNGETFGPPIKACILYCKGLVGWLIHRIESLVGQLIIFVDSGVSQTDCVVTI